MVGVWIGRSPRRGVPGEDPQDAFPFSCPDPSLGVLNPPPPSSSCQIGNRKIDRFWVVGPFPGQRGPARTLRRRTVLLKKRQNPFIVVDFRCGSGWRKFTHEAGTDSTTDTSCKKIHAKCHVEEIVGENIISMVAGCCGHEIWLRSKSPSV